MGLHDRTAPTHEEFLGFRERFSNWGRWGADDDLGTLNHITPEVRRYAASLVTEGITVSLGKPLATEGGPLNPRPVQHEMTVHEGGSRDFIGISCHGIANSHIDALCHFFTGLDGQLYNGRPVSDVTDEGALTHGIERWRDGIVSRGVLYDIPRLRGKPFVTIEQPVQGWELLDAAERQGVEPRAGDVVLIRSSLERFLEAHPITEDNLDARPGVHVSCAEFLYETNAAALGWDALEARGQGYPPGTPRGSGMASVPLHEITIPYMGMALLDALNLERAAETCERLSRWEFQLAVAPLIINGGTGSPVNPIATF